MTDLFSFPPGTVRMEKPKPADIRKLPDGTFDITVRFTRLAMTALDRARAIRCPTHAPHDHAACIAAAIEAAVADEREACAKFVDELGDECKHDVAITIVAYIAAAIRARTETGVTT